MNFGKAFFMISGLLSIIVTPIGSIITEIGTRCSSFRGACNPYHNQPCCSQHLVCKRFKNQQHECLCDVDYEWFGNKCIQTFLELSSKSSEEECQETEFLLYIQGKCFCPVNHVMVDGRNCLPLLNEICSQNKPCVVHNSDCINGRLLKKPCRSNYDCFNVPFAECSTNKTCACKTNYVTSENGSCLLPVVGICAKNSDCKSKNSYCHFNRCQCIKNFVGQIINGVYECKQISLGFSCETAHDCGTIRNSQCLDNVCVCFEKYYALDNGITCVPRIGGYCSEDIDCAFAIFRCFNNFCECQPGYVSVSDNQCVLKSSAISCDMGIECGEHWHSDCSLDHTCFCKSNNTQVNQATCSPILG
ncbi:hypothetical protein KQX54_019697 [Cotesia glomerata]|uniref:Uncharacterized protein n=1 Tax=Cotesia glomerata TaxID=32391 RepID=A0AAV7HZ50_COTGL|nr:hypothetical protein KQX54_019697 [Cotesia glomerata]